MNNLWCLLRLGRTVRVNSVALLRSSSCKIKLQIQLKHISNTKDWQCFLLNKQLHRSSTMWTQQTDSNQRASSPASFTSQEHDQLAVVRRWKHVDRKRLHHSKLCALHSLRLGTHEAENQKESRPLHVYNGSRRTQLNLLDNVGLSSGWLAGNVHESLDERTLPDRPNNIRIWNGTVSSEENSCQLALLGLRRPLRGGSTTATTFSFWNRPISLGRTSSAFPQ